MIELLLTAAFFAPPSTESQQPARDRPADAFRVVGYLPEYRIGSFDPESAKYLTDLIYFAAEPGSGGEANLDRIKPGTLRVLKSIKDKHGVRIHLCLGGWGRSKGFGPLAGSPAARKKLADEVTQFCRQNAFDGVDVDWEHPTTKNELRDHAALLADLKSSLKPHGLRLTIALAPWQQFLPQTIEAIDGIHLMTYDNKGRHSTYEYTQASIDKLLKKVPAEKLYLGLPFYGRGIDTRDRTLTYAQIVKKYGPRADLDEVDGVYFNGIKTIERKTQLALTQKLGGVMIWEVGQDAAGEQALLPAIHRTIRMRP